MRHLYVKIASRKFLALVVILAGMGVTSSARTPQEKSAAQLVLEFKSAKYFWQQLEVGRKLVALGDTSVLQEFETFLSDEDRHLRGNAAFVLAGLGDDRGWNIIAAILDDRSPRPEGHGIPFGKWSLSGQIRADRYYAVHLFGILKDRRAVPTLIPLLRDPEVNYKVPWALGEIGDKSAIRPLIAALGDESPDMRVTTIRALEKLGAKEALPNLRALLQDNEQTHNGKPIVSVAEVARAAIIKLEETP